MKNGTVRWFSRSYGYGFIEDERGQDIFVHFSVIQQPGYRSLEDGQVVAYEREAGPKGDYATVVIPSEPWAHKGALSARSIAQCNDSGSAETAV